jgi:hypothetical protein
MTPAPVRQTRPSTSNWHRIVQIAIVVGFVIGLTAVGNAQGLNGEGVTGPYLTPYAYTQPSPAKGLGHPTFAFHYLAAGPVIGDYFISSFTVGAFKHVEFGYTRWSQSAGKSPLGSEFKGGFDTFHGKVNFLPENTNQKRYIPGVAAGFVVRTNIPHVYGAQPNKQLTNGEIYVVATKQIKFSENGPGLLLNAGVKATNAAVYGVAGNSPYWQGRMFGDLGLTFKGLKFLGLGKGHWGTGVEAVQEDHHVKGLPLNATIPTTIAYVFRMYPKNTLPLNFDFAVTQAVGRVMPGVDVMCQGRIATGLSYRF